VPRNNTSLAVIFHCFKMFSQGTLVANWRLLRFLTSETDPLRRHFPRAPLEVYGAHPCVHHHLSSQMGLRHRCDLQSHRGIAHRGLVELHLDNWLVQWTANQFDSE